MTGNPFFNFERVNCATKETRDTYTSQHVMLQHRESSLSSSACLPGVQRLRLFDLFDGDVGEIHT